MYIVLYNNENKLIVDVEDGFVLLNYFNIVKFKKGEIFEYVMSGYEICVVSGIGMVDVDVDGVKYFVLGNCMVDVWDGEFEGVYVFVGVKVWIICVIDKIEIFIVGVKYDKVLELFDVCVVDLDVV